MPLIVVVILHFLVVLSYSSPIRGEISGEFILFPDIETINHSGLAKNSESEDSEFGAGIDFFLTANYKKLRFLGEYLLAKDEQELERLQFGFSFDESTVWVGRFHNPIGYWNTNFHHGRFLETSASRPAIANFEDDGGILPMHISGLLAEGTYAYGERGLGYSFALGAGPSSTMHGLEPWDAINPSSGKQDISATLNVFIEPMVYAPTKFGFYVNYTDIPTQGITATGIQQISAGLYGNWESFPWRILSSSFYVHNKIDQSGGSREGSFIHSYLQTEYTLDNYWTLFSRAEGTFVSKNDVYLALLPGFIEDRIIGGIRFDFAKNNALKVEVSENRLNGDSFEQFIVQWSASF